jgi:hypothetical protein
MTQQQSPPGGTILRGQDGTWYYIRDDQLGPFEVKDKETLDAFKSLETADGPEESEDVSGFALISGGPATFDLRGLRRIGFDNLALRANFGLGIGVC